MTPLDEASAAPGNKGVPFVGGRAALVLAVAMLAGFAAINLLHWRQAASSVALETVIQQPVPADNAPPDTRSEATAPDPGDNP